MWPAMNVENPKNSPPSTDGQNRCVSRWHTRYVAHAASAGASSSNTLSATSVPNAAVNGYATIPRLGMNVTHEMSTPAGENTSKANNGECPCRTAHGVHARAHW